MLPDNVFERTPVPKSQYVKPWMEDFEFILVTKDNISLAIDECIESGMYGLDTETTGLDTRVYPICDGGALKTNVDLVGICLSPDKTNKGYYIPVRHTPYGTPWPGNVPYSIVEEEMGRLVESNSIAVFHNAKYDQEILAFNGGKPFGMWDDPNKWEDTSIIIYLYDPLKKGVGLKKLSKEFLGREMIELRDLFGDDKDFNFGELDPSIAGCVEYAASDAINTLALYHSIYERAMSLESTDVNGKKHSQKMVYHIEKMTNSAVRWMERCRIHIDLNRTQDLMKTGQRELYESLKGVYSGSSEHLKRDITPVSFHLLNKKLNEIGGLGKLEITLQDPQPLRRLIDECRSEAKRLITLYDKNDFGVMVLCQNDEELGKILGRETPPPKGGIPLLKEYDILSASQLGVLIHDLGVEIKRTDKGNIQTSEEVLDEILEKEGKKIPFLSGVGIVRSNYNALNRLSAMFVDADRRDNTVKVGFNQKGTETGRFSVREHKDGSKSKKDDGTTRFNPQSTPAMYDRDVPDSVYYTRACISSRPRKNGSTGKIVALDWSGVELRIIANFSGEKKWVDAFFSCSDCQKKFDRDSTPPKYCPVCGSDKIGDVHTKTALELFGEDSPSKPNWKALRSYGKQTNFATCYGGGYRAVQHSTGVNENEAHRIVRKFRASYTTLKKWWDSKHAFARKYKYVLTAFGRKFPVPDILDENSYIRSAAERNSLNSPIQGTSADLTKISMALVYNECKKRGWIDDVFMIITMHDEIVFDVSDHILEEFCRMSIDIMTKNKAILTRNWQVPLTVDCEIGNDWSVPWNLFKIEESIKIRRDLQRVENTDADIKRILRRVDGFFGEDKLKKLGSFRNIKCPQELSELFEFSKNDSISEDEGKKLDRAWKIYFNEDIDEAVSSIKNGVVPTVPAPNVPEKELPERDTKNSIEDVLVIDIDSLTIVEAQKVIDVVKKFGGTRFSVRFNGEFLMEMGRKNG